MKWLKLPFKYIIAFLRLDLRTVCEMSAGKGLYNDFHDYPDDEQGFPLHFVALKCKRCGKEFYI